MLCSLAEPGKSQEQGAPESLRPLSRGYNLKLSAALLAGRGNWSPPSGDPCFPLAEGSRVHEPESHPSITKTGPRWDLGTCRCRRTTGDSKAQRGFSTSEAQKITWELLKPQRPSHTSDRVPPYSLGWNSGIGMF